MNAEHVLRVHVERIVRPIVAAEKDKLTMRDELYAHALDALASEQSRSADGADVTTCAIDRLGDAPATRRELQSTVGWESRFNYYSDRLIRRSPGDTLLWHAAKLAMLSTVALAVFTALLVVPLKASELWRWTFQGQLTVRVLLAYAALFGAGMFFGTILSNAAWRLADRRFDRSGDWLKATTVMAATAVLLCLLGWCFTYAVSSDAEASFAILRQWLALSTLAAPGVLIVPYLDVHQRRPLAEWLELDLEAMPSDGPPFDGLPSDGAVAE